MCKQRAMKTKPIRIYKALMRSELQRQISCRQNRHFYCEVLKRIKNRKCSHKFCLFCLVTRSSVLWTAFLKPCIREIQEALSEDEHGQKTTCLYFYIGQLCSVRIRSALIPESFQRTAALSRSGSIGFQDSLSRKTVFYYWLSFYYNL